MRDKMKKDFIRNAEFGLRNLTDLGAQGAFAPAGHNGPYYHIETPVRNSSHWLISFIIAYKLTDRSEFLAGAVRTVNWLSDNVYLKQGQFIHRRGGTDTCNGVIGDAWVVEALAMATNSGDNDLIKPSKELLETLVSRQKLNNRTRAYYRFEQERGYLSEDYTFNHQLWLSMALASVPSRCEEALANLDYYLAEALQVREDGLIHHVYKTQSSKNYLNRLRYTLSEKRNRATVNLKERGYHLFNLYAFARFDLTMHSDLAKRNEKIKAAVSYIDNSFIKQLFDEKNKYAFNYNSPGYEIPMVCSYFEHPDANALIQQAYELHKSRCWNDEVGAFINNVDDPMTSAARAYELGFYLIEKRLQ